MVIPTRDLIPNISEVQDGKLENRQKKLHCELLQTDVTKANFRQSLFLDLFQLMNKYPFCQTGQERTLACTGKK